MLVLPCPDPTVQAFPHAVALAPVTIQDSEVGNLVDIEFAHGHWRSANLAPQLLRLGDSLLNHREATLYFRTDNMGVLREYSYTVDLLPPSRDGEVFSRGALRKPVEFDLSAGKICLRVNPAQAHIQPFLITAHVAPDLPDPLPGAELCQLRGRLEGAALLVEQIEPAYLPGARPGSRRRLAHE